MKKQEKFFNGYRGIIIFYIMVAVLALLVTKRIENINSQALKKVEVSTCYA